VKIYYFPYALKYYHLGGHEVQNNHNISIRKGEHRRIERNAYFFAWLASERSKNSIATRPSTELSAYPA